VDVDSVLRKEVFMDCKTPSNPHPIEPGYTQSIYETVEHFFGKAPVVGDSVYQEELPSIPQVSKLYTPDLRWQGKSSVLEEGTSQEIVSVMAGTPNNNFNRISTRSSKKVKSKATMQPRT
jgi:hypothetical protein